jgi:hypothetical protein
VSTWLDRCVSANLASIERDAASAGVSPAELERHVRLHLPSVPVEAIVAQRLHEAYETVRRIASERAIAIHREHQNAAGHGGTELLQDTDYICRRDLWLETNSRPRVPLRFDDVDPELGEYYQGSLHYLLTPRADTTHHFGLYLADAKWPIAYIAVSPCDRPYMAQGLAAHGFGIEDAVVLTRMHGLPGLPANAMSLMTKHVIRALRRRGTARVLLTAYNPLLGFCGAVYRASGFVPYTTAPVAYGYDKSGRYTTRRAGTGVRLSKLNTPPNVLMARGLDPYAQVALSVPKVLGRIPDDEYWADVPAVSAVKPWECGPKVQTTASVDHCYDNVAATAVSS